MSTDYYKLYLLFIKAIMIIVWFSSSNVFSSNVLYFRIIIHNILFNVRKLYIVELALFIISLNV